MRLLICAALALSACSGQQGQAALVKDTGGSAGGGGTGTGGDAAPTVRITAPQDGAVLTPDENCDVNFDVAFEVDGVTLVDWTGYPPVVDGEGYARIIWAPPSYEASFESPVSAWTSAADVEYSLEIVVDLFTVDHEPLGVSDVVSVMVAACE